MLRLASAHARRRAAHATIGMQAAAAAGVTAASSAVAASAACASVRSWSGRSWDPPRRSSRDEDNDDEPHDYDDSRPRWGRPRSGVGAAVEDAAQQMREVGAAAAGVAQRTQDQSGRLPSPAPVLASPSLQLALDDALWAIAAEDAATEGSRRTHQWPTFAAHLRLLSAAIEGFAEAQAVSSLSADAARTSRRDFFTWVQASAGTLWAGGADALASPRGSAANARALLRYYHTWLEFSVHNMDSPRLKWTLLQIEHWDRVRNKQLQRKRAASWLHHPRTLGLLLTFYQSLLTEARSKAKEADATISQAHLHKLMLELPDDALKLLPASHASDSAAAPEAVSADPTSTVAPEDAWLYPEISRSSVTLALPHIHARIAELWALSDVWLKAADTSLTQADHDAFTALQHDLLQALQMSLVPGQPPSDALQALAAQLRSKPTVWRKRDQSDSLLDTFTSIAGDSVTTSFEVMIMQHSLVRPVPDLALLTDLLGKMRQQCRPTASAYNSLLNAALVTARHTMRMQKLAPHEVDRLRLKSPLECFELMQRLLAEMRTVQPNGKPLAQANSSTFIVLVNAHSLASLADCQAGFEQAAQHLPALLALYEDMLHTVASPHIRLLNQFLQSFARLENPRRPDLSLQIYQAILTYGEVDASGTRQLRNLDEEGRVSWADVLPNSLTFEIMLSVFARAGMVKQAVSCYTLLLKLAARPPPEVEGEEALIPTAESIQLLMQLMLREKDPVLHAEVRPMVDSLFNDLTRFGLHKNLEHFTYTLRARIEMQHWAGVEALAHELAFSSSPSTKLALSLARQPPVFDTIRPINLQFRHQAMDALVLAGRVDGVRNVHNWLLPDASEPFMRFFEQYGNQQQVGGGYWQWSLYDYLQWLERAQSLPMFRAIVSLMPRADASCAPDPIGSLRLSDTQWNAVLLRLLHKNPLYANFWSWKRYAISTGRTDFHITWPVFLSSNPEYVASIHADPLQAERLERFSFELLCAEVKHEWLQAGFYGAEAATSGQVLQLGYARSIHAHVYCERELFRRSGRGREWVRPADYPAKWAPRTEPVDALVDAAQQSQGAWPGAVGAATSQGAAAAEIDRVAEAARAVQTAREEEEQRMLYLRAEAEASARARAAALDARKKREDERKQQRQATRPSIEPNAAAAPLSFAAAVEQAKLQTPTVADVSVAPARPRPVPASRPVRPQRIKREPAAPLRLAAALDAPALNAAVAEEPISRAEKRRKQSMLPTASQPPKPEQKKQPTAEAKLAAQLDRTLCLVAVPESFRGLQLAAYLRPLAEDVVHSLKPELHHFRIHRSKSLPGGAVVGFASAVIARRVEKRLGAIASSPPDGLPEVMRAMQLHPARIRTTPCTAEHIALLQELSFPFTGEETLADEGALLTEAPRVKGPTLEPNHVLSLIGMSDTLPTAELAEFLADHGLLPRTDSSNAIHARYCAPTFHTPGCWQVHFQSDSWLESPWGTVFLADNSPRSQKWSWRGMEVRAKISRVDTNSYQGKQGWQLIEPEQIEAVAPLHWIPLEAPRSPLLLLQGLPPAQFTSAMAVCNYLNAQGYFPELADITLGVQVTLAVARYVRQLKRFRGPPSEQPPPPTEPQDIVLFCGSMGFATCVMRSVAQQARMPNAAKDRLAISCRFLTSWPADRLSPARLGLQSWSNRATELANRYPLMRKHNSRIVTFHGFADADLAAVRDCLSKLVPNQGELGMLPWSRERILLDVGSPDAVETLLAAALKEPQAFSFEGQPLRLTRFYQPAQLPPPAESFVRWKLPPLQIDAAGQVEPAAAAEEEREDEDEDDADADDDIDDEELFASQPDLGSEIQPEQITEFTAAPALVLPRPPSFPSQSGSAMDPAVTLSPPVAEVAIEATMEAAPVVEPMPAEAMHHLRAEDVVDPATQAQEHVTESISGEPSQSLDLEFERPGATEALVDKQSHQDAPEDSGFAEPVAIDTESAEEDPTPPQSIVPAPPTIVTTATIVAVPVALMVAEAVPVPAADIPLLLPQHESRSAGDSVTVTPLPVRSASMEDVKIVQPPADIKLELPPLAVPPLSSSASAPPALARPLVIPPVFASSFRVGIRFPSVLPQHKSVFVSRVLGVPGRVFLQVLDRTRTVSEVISVFQSRFESLGLMTPFKAATRVMLANERSEVLLFPPLALLCFSPDVAAKRRNQSFRIGFRFDRAMTTNHAMVVQEINSTVNRMVRVAAERYPMPIAEPPRSAVASAEAPFGVREFFFTYAPLLIHLECHAALETLFLHFARDRQLYPALLCMHHLLHSKAHDGLDADAAPATASKDFELWKAKKFVGLNPACYDRITTLMRWSTAQLRENREDASASQARAAAAVPSPFAPMLSLLHQLLSQYSSSFDAVQRTYWGRQYCQLESASQALWVSDVSAAEWRPLLTAWLETAERAQAFVAQYRSSPFGADMNKSPPAMPLFPLSVYATWRSGARVQLDWITRTSPAQIQAATAAYLELVSPAASVPSEPAAHAAASWLLDATSVSGVSLLTLLGRLSAQLWQLQSQQAGDEALDAKLSQQAESIFREITLHAIRPSLLQDGNLTAQPIVLLACTRWALENRHRWAEIAKETALTRLVASKFVNLCKLLERIPSSDPIVVLHQRLFRVHFPLSLSTATNQVGSDGHASPWLLHALQKFKELSRSLDPESKQSREGQPKPNPGERPVTLPVLSESEPARRALIDSHIAVIMELMLTLRSQDSRDPAVRSSSGSELHTFVRAEIAELVGDLAKMSSMRTAPGRVTEASPVEYMLHALWKLHSSEQMQQRYAQTTPNRRTAPVDSAASLPLSAASSPASTTTQSFVLFPPVVLSPLLAVLESSGPLSLPALRDLVLLAQHKNESSLHQMERVVRIIERSMDSLHAATLQTAAKVPLDGKAGISGQQSAKDVAAQAARLSDISALYHSVLRFYASIHSLSHVVALLELMRQRGVASIMATFHALLIAFNGAMDAQRNRSMGDRFGGANGRGIGSAGSGAYDAQVQALYAAMTDHIRAHLKPVVVQPLGTLQLPQQPRLAAAHRPTAETLMLLLHSALHSSSLTFAQTLWSQLTGLSRTHDDDPLDAAAVSASSASPSSPPSPSPVLISPNLDHLLLMLDVFEKHGQIGPCMQFIADIGFTQLTPQTDSTAAAFSAAAAPSPVPPALLPVLRSPVFLHSLLHLLSSLAPPLDARRARLAKQSWSSAREAADSDAKLMQQANDNAETAALDIVRTLIKHTQADDTHADDDDDTTHDTNNSQTDQQTTH